MSNGTRLIAVVVVVVLAAIGLYYAFLYNPDKVPATVPVTPRTDLPDGTVPVPAPGEGPGETKSGPTGGEAIQPIPAPPSGAFAAPSGAAATAKPVVTPPTGTAGSGGGTSGPNPIGGSSPSGSSGGGSGAAGALGTEYAIQSGDTLEGLAQRFLGDRSKWRLIADANPGLNPNALKVGQRIRVPSSGATTAAPTPDAGGGTGGASGANTYTVLKGDTLIGISRKVYGNEADWRRILEANGALLHGDSAALKPGMKLAIPAKK
jgi:nucleoid-associated protein YgaU